MHSVITHLIDDSTNRSMAPFPLKGVKAAATARFLKIAGELKAEAGILEHIVTKKSLTGRTTGKAGTIAAPEGRTRKQLYILARECARIALKHDRSNKPNHVQELEAEQWAHEALRQHGVPVPRAMTLEAKKNVAKSISTAIQLGAKEIASEALAYAGISVVEAWRLG
jgi:hypothetical protein